MATIGRFVGGIGALLYNPENNTYLLLKRSADRDYGGGNWECVTGRVDQGEGFETALHREVMEEIGVTVQIEYIVSTSHFYRGAPTPENELIGIVYCCTTADPTAIQKSIEHSEYRWVTAAEAYTLLNDPDSWLHKVIERAEIIRQHLSAELKQLHRDQGFEIT
jgi:8-oxo-dGTP pyrophosphatase MutT (NUDIX family)